MFTQQHTQNKFLYLDLWGIQDILDIIEVRTIHWPMELPIQFCALIPRKDSVLFHRIYRKQCVEFQFVFVSVCINKMNPRNKRLGTGIVHCHAIVFNRIYYPRQFNPVSSHPRDYETSIEFMKCRLHNFSMGFILYVNPSHRKNK